MNSKKVLLVVILVCLVIFGSYKLGAYLAASIDRNTPTAACPNTMAAIIQSAKGDVYVVDPDYVQPDSSSLITYDVWGDQIGHPVLEEISSDLITQQMDTADQQRAWQLFSSLIPRQNRRVVSEYMVFTDGPSNTLAAVDQILDSPTQWSVQVDIADLENEHALTFTLLHEYGHILTLNSTQVTPDVEAIEHYTDPDLMKKKAEACPYFFAGNGCSLPNSYLNLFYERFWVDIESEWAKIDALQYEQDQQPYYAGLYDFYQTHRDQFVDDYATTHPDEDIAESFAYFVFSPKPSGNSIIDQKIRFFYDFPELVSLRQDINTRVCSHIQE
jgi:hypothetical protein